MSAPEFSHIVTVADAAQGRGLTLEADEATRAAIAKRLGLVALDRFVVTAEIHAVAGGIAVRGRIEAKLVQSCAATDLPVPAKVDEVFDLRFLRDAEPAANLDEEVEISDADLDILPLEGERADVGEAAVQTMSLALDPFPRHPDADRILAEKGVLSEEQAGPFAALAKLRSQPKP
mgnify:CR=1 FL=1